MTIKEEIKEKAVARLLPKYIKKFLEDSVWAWSEVRDAAQNTNAEGRAEITRELANTRVIKEHLRGLAEAEVDALLVDDSLNLNELNRIYGDG